MAQQEINIKRMAPIAIIIAIVVLIIVFWSSITITIDAGSGGVLYKRFDKGVDTTATYGEGFHFIMPWNKMII